MGLRTTKDPRQNPTLVRPPGRTKLKIEKNEN
jgi:hypothetical protein